ncbi:MAG: phosphoglucosamine mutase [Clostridia bacterium]|nr:phosphoglucosamine mutase [Clostridia bacterium]
MGKYFGTDGFRGEANVTLTVEHAYKIGKFLGWYFNERCREGNKCRKAKIVIGKDTRLSGYMFEYALAGAIASTGAAAYLLHVTTTPCVAYVTKTEDFDCGIMISASHNPFYDNGIKIINSKGEKMEDEVTDLIEKYIDGEIEEVPCATGAEIGKAVDYEIGRSRYIEYLLDLSIYSFRGKKIGLDCANGSAWKIASQIFRSLGATVYLIGAEPNGININKESGSTHIEKLQNLVTASKLDVGFAFDGDADRCLCVDENGEVVDGDAILYIYGSYLKKRGELENNTVVTTVMSNYGLFKAFDELGIDYAKTAVGDRFVNEYMVKNNCIIGGEQSGHIIFSRYASTGDGLLTAIKMMEVMLSENKTLSELCAPFKRYPQMLINVRVKDKKKALSSEKVLAAQKEAEAALEGRGRLLLRESGTEPVIRVMVECDNEEFCRKYAESVAEAVKNA